MQRAIEISFMGKESSFKANKIERSKLYGNRRRIPVDGFGRECSYASLTIDGKYILPPGSTCLLYLDESGEVVERDRLQTVAPNKDIIANHNGSEGIMETGQAVQVMELLDYRITHAYFLEPVFLSPELAAALSRGDIYHLPGFNDQENRRAFLLGSDSGGFVLLGFPTGFEFIGLPEADLSLPDMNDDPRQEAELSSDLDFTMW